MAVWLNISTYMNSDFVVEDFESITERYIDVIMDFSHSSELQMKFTSTKMYNKISKYNMFLYECYNCSTCKILLFEMLIKLKYFEELAEECTVVSKSTEISNLDSIVSRAKKFKNLVISSLISTPCSFLFSPEISYYEVTHNDSNFLLLLR